MKTDNEKLLKMASEGGWKPVTGVFTTAFTAWASFFRSVG